MPAENGKNAHSVGLSGDALAEEALKVAQTNLEKGNENHEKLARALATNNEETRRLSALLVDTQEKHGNMLRELSRDIQLIRGSRRGILQGFQERLSSPMSSVHRSPTGSRSASIEPKRKGQVTKAVPARTAGSRTCLVREKRPMSLRRREKKPLLLKRQSQSPNQSRSKSRSQSPIPLVLRIQQCRGSDWSRRKGQCQCQSR